MEDLVRSVTTSIMLGTRDLPWCERLISGAWPVSVGGRILQRGGYLGVPARYRVQVPVRRGRGSVPEPAVTPPCRDRGRWLSQPRCVNIVLLADSSSKGSLMGLLDTLKGLVGRRKGQADEGVDKFANRAKQEADGTSPRLSDVDSEEESEIDIEEDSRP